MQTYAQGPRNSIKLDGYDDYVELSTSNRGVIKSITVEAWIKTGSAKYHWVLGKYDRYNESGYHLIIKNGKAAFAGRDGSGNYRNSGYSSTYVNDNNWHHLAGICNNGTWLIYVDGVVESHLATGYPNTDLKSNAMMAIGKDYLANNENYIGQVDEIKVWKRALSAEEIRQGMCQFAKPASPDLIVYLKFDEGAGSTVKDYSLSNISGSFRNINPATAWTISGAPVGDKSTYLYTSNWQGKKVELSGDNSTFAAYGLSNTTQGFQIYYTSSAPNSTIEIENPGQVNDYYGIFKVGGEGSSYTTQYDEINTSCFNKLYRRPDNTAEAWEKVAEALQIDPLTYINSEAQSEYALGSSSVGTVEIISSGNFCTGSNTTLSVNTNASVLWNTGETSKIITVTKAGEYSVTVEENGCTYTNKIIIKEIAPPAVNLGPDRVLCTGETARLQAPVGPYTYRWSNGETTPAINTSTSGDYWVQVTNSDGCSTVDALNIKVNPKPVISLPATIDLCPGESTILSASVPTAQYVWSTGEITETVSVSAPGNYWVDVTLNNCTYHYQTRVVTKAISPPDISGPVTLCTGSQATLSIEAPTGQIVWSNGATGKSIQITKGGKYSVSVTNSGCILMDFIEVQEVAPDLINLGGDQTICAGEVLILTAPAGMAAYQWSTGATSPFISVTVAGTYWVEVTNAAGCVSRDEMTLTVTPEPDINLSAQITACFGQIVEIGAAVADASYRWNTGQTTATIRVSTAGIYEVAYTLNGCTYTKAVEVIADECPTIPNIITPNSDGKNDTFVVQGVEPGTLTIEIFSRWGKSIYQSARYGNNWSAADAPTGTYYYQFTSRRTGKVYKGWLEVMR